MRYRSNHIWVGLLAAIAGFLLHSCSLVKIESEQKPLGVKELNTRILTQNFARNAMDRVELAADSILNLAAGNKTVQLNTLQWKINTSEELGRLSFQTEPKIALMDTWAYFLEVQHSLESPELDPVFGTCKAVALDAITQNIDEIQRIAASILGTKEYQRIEEFVQDYARNTPLMSQKEFKHKSIRESYLEFQKIPDSIAVQTVGTLSEVVADATNRLEYFSDASGKRFSWKAEMLLRQKGLDSITIEAKMAELESQFDRLLVVAENAPENLEGAIKEFRNNIGPLFSSLNYEIRLAMKGLSSDVELVDNMLLRERIALDSIIARERMALTIKADQLVDTGIKSAAENLERTVRNLLLYFILFLIVLLGLPFYIGYRMGRRKPNDS